MSSIIEDGKGTGNKLQIDKNNRAHTRSVTASEVVSATIEGNAYLVSSGIQTITNDTDNYLLYIKNDSDLDLVIERTTLVIGESTGGATNESTFLGQLNPTGGTIISSGLSFSPFNLNLASANSFDGTATIATSLGLTATGGLQADGLVPDKGERIFNNRFILPRGSSLSGGFKAPSGNTSMKVSIAYTIYFRDPEVI